MVTKADNSANWLLEMRSIKKSFAGVAALKGVSMDLAAGEVLAIVGENGAGKSTLIKILGGAHQPDQGEILIDGRHTTFPTPSAAQRAGIAIIYQEFNLLADLSVRENIFLGREPTRFGLIRHGQQRLDAQALFAKIGCTLDADVRCRDLTVPQQQMVEIAKALSMRARIVVMDEPTAALAEPDVQRLFGVIRDLKSHGLGILYVSHRLEEIFSIADRVLVLRDGQRIGCYPVGDVTREKLIEMMVGRPMETEFPPRSVPLGEERLRVEGLSRPPSVRDVSLAVRAGEVVGLAGLAGAGRTETVRLLFGADSPVGGRITIDGRPAVIRHPRDAIRQRICLLTEDRKSQGLVLRHSVQENFGLPNLKRFGWGPFLDQRGERREFNRYVDQLHIKVTNCRQPAAHLSGGNQQKVVLAKWLARQANIMIFDEPTRGIDVGAKYEIYLLINQLAQEGKAVLLVSSEIPELLGMCDRILVMHQGQIKREIVDVQHATQEDILSVSVT